MDGYNWGTDNKNAWQSWAQILTGDPRYGGHNTYQELLDVAPTKPIMIGETASSEHGGSKAAWITDFLQSLPTAFPKVKAFIWFNWNVSDPNGTFPIESSPTAQSAFAAGIASSAYARNDYSTLSTVGVLPLSAPSSQSANPAALTPVADTYISRANVTSTSGGISTDLRADLGGTDTTFMTFNLSALAGKTITSASLRVHTSSQSWSGSNAIFDVKQVQATDWKEQWMSYNNPVPISSTVLGSLSGATTSNTWYQVNLTQLAPIQSQAGGLLSIAVTGRTGDVLIINSRESGANAAQLVVAYR